MLYKFPLLLFKKAKESEILAMWVGRVVEMCHSPLTVGWGGGWGGGLESGGGPPKRPSSVEIMQQQPKKARSVRRK